MAKYLDANIICKTKDMGKIEWLRKRQGGIGGSDASCVLGLNPYKSSMSVYLEKVCSYKKDVGGLFSLKSDKLGQSFGLENNGLEFKDLETKNNYKMYLGNKLEDFVASEFSLKTNKKTRNVNGILKNDKYPFAIANIDKAIVGEKAFLECIVTNSFSKNTWQKKVPPHYKIQCFHYMAVTGASHCYVAVLVGNEDLIIHRLDRDEEIIDEIMKLEKMFWDNCVMGDSLPMPDGSDDYSKVLQSVYKYTKDKEIVLYESSDLLKRYDELLSFIKDIDKEKKAIEQYIKLQMKDYEVAFIGDRKITWKSQIRNTIDSKKLKENYKHIADECTKTSTTRVFKI